MEGFDRIPDALLLLVFNFVSDVKTLFRCRAVSKRFNLLVPRTQSLLLKLDSFISTDTDDVDLDLHTFLTSVLKSMHHILSREIHPIGTRSLLNSPAQILRGFETIKDLEIELPSDDHNSEKNVVLIWRADFGKTLRSCVIFGFREILTSPPSVSADMDFAGEMNLRVEWTISALTAAYARHYVLREVAKERRELERLVLKDEEGEGMVVMDKEGLRELRDGAEAHFGLVNCDYGDYSPTMLAHLGPVSCEGDGDSTTMPSARLRMLHGMKLDLKGGAWVDGPTLVVLRPTSSSSSEGGETEMQEEDAELAMEAFRGGVYGEAVQALLETPSYPLDIDNF